MIALLGAVLQHVVRIATFRHDGRGLPAERGGALYLLMVIAGLSRLAVDRVDPEGADIVNSVAGTVAYLFLLAVLIRPAPMGALLLTNLFGNVVAAVLYLAGVNNPYVSTALIAWEVSALMMLIYRMVQRAQGEQKNRNTKNN
ncbi:hypothetical protein [Burkholderia ubonensis]|uniref:hypothetical protein n=1 Tax=Burkholderia ubonensis TaxID=101571 RepID=UPI00075B20B7|nr:hypothetical protein [Burkholderia ubonensis]KVP17183.1 hypothetical protein WJ84_02575 [Burkholderia ubonensis]